MELGGSLPHSQKSTTCPYPSQINPFLCSTHVWQDQLVSFLVWIRTYQHPGIRINRKMRPNLPVCVHIVFLRKFGLQIISSSRGPESLPYSRSRKKKNWKTLIYSTVTILTFSGYTSRCIHMNRSTGLFEMIVGVLTTATSFSRCNPMWFLSLGLRQGSGLCSSSSRKVPGT